MSNFVSVDFPRDFEIHDSLWTLRDIADGEVTLAAERLIFRAEAPGLPTVTAKVNLHTSEAEELPFAGGQAIDLSNPGDEGLSTLKDAVKKKGASLLPQFMLHPSVLSNLSKLVSE